MSSDRSEWFKSSYSQQNGECVEARRSAAGLDLRDTKDHRVGTLAFTAAAWSAFLGDVKQDASRTA
ncbi:DUF397 domain-containing protein [Streptomyces sp. NPDC056323]|uniref:DUF397 domain-containing protein n=1 Tax=Streptomyces sp. NPDC056323 TaxID=3345784 RepID=UPI0035DC3B83